MIMFWHQKFYLVCVSVCFNSEELPSTSPPPARPNKKKNGLLPPQSQPVPSVPESIFILSSRFRQCNGNQIIQSADRRRSRQWHLLTRGKIHSVRHKKQPNDAERHPRQQCGPASICRSLPNGQNLGQRTDGLVSFFFVHCTSRP